MADPELAGACPNTRYPSTKTPFGGRTLLTRQNGVQVTLSRELSLKQSLTSTARFHQRDTRSSLFSSYDAQARPRPSSASPAGPSSTRASSNPYSSYGSNSYGGYSSDAPPDGHFAAAYPGSGGGIDRSRSAGGFRAATPNSKGQYSDSVLAELESQNDDEVSEMSRKVEMLKNVSFWELADAEGKREGAGKGRRKD